MIQEYFKLIGDWYNAPRIDLLRSQIKLLPKEEQLIFILRGGAF